MAEEEGAGILKLTCIDAKLTRDTEMLGSMSPYITIAFNGNKYKTKIHDNGGKEPVWGDEFTLEVTNYSEELIIRCWDKDLTTSDAVGFAKIKLSALIFNNGVDDWFDIMYENKGAGSVHITTEFEPEGGDKFEQMQEMLTAQNEKLAEEKAEAEAKVAELEEHKNKIQAELAEQEEKAKAEKEALDAQLAEAESAGD